VPPLRAGVGDVVLVMNEGREMLGICNGVNVVTPGEFGMVALGMEAALAAWKI
jgi:phosphoribosylformylglycinamidine (FGAM) synthase-like amidotransferase family enzyme